MFTDPVEEHSRRIRRPLVDAWGDYERAQATLLDLSRLAEQASTALENANPPASRLIWLPTSDHAADVKTASVNDGRNLDGYRRKRDRRVVAAATAALGQSL